MNKALFLLHTLCCLGILSACTSSQVDKTHDGIIIHLQSSGRHSAKQLRLQVINDDIIRVSASPTDTFSTKSSLIVDPVPSLEKEWYYSEAGDNIQLKTTTLSVDVSRKTGEITFTDMDGHTLLAENTGGGKSFQAIEVDGHEAFSLRQVFESPDDEAFYGLGQHQSDEFNYKGKNETLYQYNTKVSVPFIVSSKNYGLLWDNYSLTKFGDPRDYDQLNRPLFLYDKTGTPGALTLTCRTLLPPGNLLLEKRDSTIDYDHLETIRTLSHTFPLSSSAVVWEGEIQAKQSGTYRFMLHYAGYISLHLDNKPLVGERWRTAWNPNSYKFAVQLEAGEKHPIRIEWKPDGDVSYLSLKVLSPTDPSEQSKLSLWSEMGDQIDYYFIRGHSIDKVISGYRTLTGKAQVMPKWAMGFWQSRERYRTQDELLEVLREFRRRQIPIDNIVQDWSYWPEDAWGSHDFDPERFPDPAAMIDEVHQQNARFMISVWPKFYHTTEHYQAFHRNGWIYRQAIVDSIRDWIGPGYIGSFYDAFSPGARQLFWQQISRKLYRYGVDAWWLDAPEPDILSNASIDYRKKLMNPTALGPATAYFNAYALLNAKGIYEGQRAEDPHNRRVFLLTRSGFAGSQRYGAAIWSGDIATRWEDLKAQIPAGLNFSLSGNPYWTMDNGGFCVEKRYEKAPEGSADREEWRELNVRWHQFGAFTPLFRTHGQYPYRELWNIAPSTHPAYPAMLYYTRLRYRLLPYIYSLAGRAHHDDYTLMRPLLMDYATDSLTRDIGHQYLFGPGLMICPIFHHKARSRDVYFPRGTTWYNLYTGRALSGGRTRTVAAPYHRLPVFVAAGSILPLGKTIQNTTQRQTDLTLYVYEGNDGTFTLYEDNGTDYEYETGAYSVIPITYDDRGKTLTLGHREGNYPHMDTHRRFRIIRVSPRHPIGIDSIAPGRTIDYNGEAQIIELDKRRTNIKK
jgi:alpha-D-xyloside xylohydrolase